jgi:hypothetical protein
MFHKDWKMVERTFAVTWFLKLRAYVNNIFVIPLKYVFEISHTLHNAGNVAGANLHARDALEVKGTEIRGAGGTADNEAHAVRTINITSQWQCFVVHYLSFYVGNIFCLHTYAFVFLLPTS